MKAFCVALCVLLALEAAWCHPASEKEMEVLRKCAAENSVKYDDLKAFLDDKDVTKDAKCFMKCTMLAFGTLSEDGTIQADDHFKESGHEELAAIAAACTKIEKNDDLCELAHQHGLRMLKQDADGKMKEHMLETLENL
ncbi:uncharacterized protein LOC117651416 [Thrips palmi]|uniref:Uncharacterized protein LOC117651416 n=1 Tax=Thrips palmi TaxID=161013 RepID=A0A6P9A0X4_THRPL|nr:uncharacterized protein LOC117651416 [Thrips palmi]